MALEGRHQIGSNGMSRFPQMRSDTSHRITIATRVASSYKRDRLEGTLVRVRGAAFRNRIACSGEMTFCFSGSMALPPPSRCRATPSGIASEDFSVGKQALLQHDGDGREAGLDVRERRDGTAQGTDHHRRPPDSV